MKNMQSVRMKNKKGVITIIKEKCRALIEYEWIIKVSNGKEKIARIVLFDLIISIIILINSVLVAVQTFNNNPVIDTIQEIITWIFVLEIIIRFIGAPSPKAYFSNGWNWFDIIIILITHIPDIFIISGNSASGIRAFRLIRTLRALRVLRIFKVFKELSIMVKVLMKSVSSVLYAGLLLLLFSYLYAIVGIMLFKGEMQIEGNVDPFGNLGEALFSLYRIATGDSWTQFRYHLALTDKEIPAWVINTYFISWHVVSAFLLLNIFFGAIIANYEEQYKKKREKRIGEILEKKLQEKEEKEKEEFEDIVLNKLKEIEDKLNKLQRK